MPYLLKGLLEYLKLFFLENEMSTRDYFKMLHGLRWSQPHLFCALWETSRLESQLQKGTSRC